MTLRDEVTQRAAGAVDLVLLVFSILVLLGAAGGIVWMLAEIF